MAIWRPKIRVDMIIEQKIAEMEAKNPGGEDYFAKNCGYFQFVHANC